ncbi:MAG: hypothetical protein LBW85_06865 [Deltaproteobacteria bacterium]|jgi:hypothetical protein|nr:hypothetical protein [Deltaproteobacteria bacterium]
MRLFTAAATIAAAALAAAALSLPLHAQWTEDFISDFAKNAPRPSGVSAAERADTLVPQACPNSPFTYSVSYPRGLDGGGPADKAAGAFAARLFAQGRSTAEEYASTKASPADCDDAWGTDKEEGESQAYFKVTSSPYRVSSGAYSVLYSSALYTGGAHESFGYASQNILADGTEITFARLFRDPAGSLPRLWEKVYKGFCGGGAAPSRPDLYGGMACTRSVPGAPGVLGPNAMSLDAAGHAVLTSLGLSFHLNPYEAYGFAAGPQFLDIPKEELLRIGADPEIWR